MTVAQGDGSSNGCSGCHLLNFLSEPPLGGALSAKAFRHCFLRPKENVIVRGAKGGAFDETSHNSKS
jgi:hypothetical protein